MTSGVNAISGIAWKSAKESAHRPEPQTSSKPGRPPDLKFWRGMMHLKWHLECRHKERNKWDDWLVKARIPAVRNSNPKSRGSVGSWWSKALLHATRFGSRFTYKKGKKNNGFWTWSHWWGPGPCWTMADWCMLIYCKIYLKITLRIA